MASVASGHRHWPAEVWEALFATLYREAGRRDPRWIEGFGSALRGVIGRALRRQLHPFSISDFVADLERLTVVVPTGRPKGKERPSPERTDWLYRSLLIPLERGWSRRPRRYTPDTLATVAECWEVLAALGHWENPVFPREELAAAIAAKRRPREVAQDVLLRAGLGQQDAHRAVTRAKDFRKPRAILREMRARLKERASPDS